jgi:hypothetical protein
LPEPARPTALAQRGKPARQRTRPWRKVFASSRTCRRNTDNYRYDDPKVPIYVSILIFMKPMQPQTTLEFDDTSQVEVRWG